MILKTQNSSFEATFDSVMRHGTLKQKRKDCLKEVNIDHKGRVWKPSVNGGASIWCNTNTLEFGEKI